MLHGEAGAGLGADDPGASHCRALLTAGVSFSNQRAVGAKALWEVNQVSTLYLLHFWCLLQATFRLLPVWPLAFLTALQHLKREWSWSWCATSPMTSAQASSRPGCQTS